MYRNLLIKLIPICAERCTNINQLKLQLAVRLNLDFNIIDEKSQQYFELDRKKFILSLKNSLCVLENIVWQKDIIHNSLRDLSSKIEYTPKEIFQPLRIVFTGSMVSEPVDELLFALGKSFVTYKLKKNIKLLTNI